MFEALHGFSASHRYSFGFCFSSSVRFGLKHQTKRVGAAAQRSAQTHWVNKASCFVFASICITQRLPRAFGRLGGRDTPGPLSFAKDHARGPRHARGHWAGWNSNVFFARARFVRACAGGANRVEAAAPRAPCRRLLWGAERAAGPRRWVRTCAPPMVHGRLGLD